MNGGSFVNWMCVEDPFSQIQSQKLISVLLSLNIENFNVRTYQRNNIQDTCRIVGFTYKVLACVNFTRFRWLANYDTCD